MMNTKKKADMEDYKLALTTLKTEDIAVVEEESRLEVFDMDDPTVPTLSTIWPSQQCTPSAQPLSIRLQAALTDARNSTTPSSICNHSTTKKTLCMFYCCHLPVLSFY